MVSAVRPLLLVVVAYTQQVMAAIIEKVRRHMLVKQRKPAEHIVVKQTMAGASNTEATASVAIKTADNKFS